MSEATSSADARTNAVTPGSRDFGYESEDAHHTDSYLFPTVLAALQRLAPGKPVFELGCGNGSTAAKLVESGYPVTGMSIPHHACLKNLALALSGKRGRHFTALWEGAHIKLWSRQTLGTLFDRVGLEEIAFERIGRVPVLAKSMIAIYRKPVAVLSVANSLTAAT